MRAAQSQLVVLGGGPGGYVAAIRAAQLGIATTLIEEHQLGGVCLNEGCVPSKALIHDAAKVETWIRELRIETGMIDERFAASAAERARTVDTLRAGVGGLLRANGVATMAGRGVLVGPHQLEVVGPDGALTLEFGNVILATGSEAIVPRGLERDGTFVVTARDVLTLESRPSHVVVIGGGYIGLELASALHHFGSQVTVVEATDRLLPGIDTELADQLHRHLVRRGITIELETTVVRAADGEVEMRATHQSAAVSPSTRTLRADVVVVAVGRRPRSHGIGLECAEIPTTPSGHVEVDEALRTCVPHIRAIGDLTPGPALAHRAMAQGRVVAESIAGHRVRFDPAAVPAVVFTSPEIATVGLQLTDALGRGLDAVQTRFPFSANARGLTLGGDGFGLLVHERSTGLVLGVHLIGPGVGELIGTATLAIEMGAVIDDLAGTIFPHPTLSEVVGELAELAADRPVHVPRQRSSLGTTGLH
jgi:dihydrolipoamide dehydrogenase